MKSLETTDDKKEENEPKEETEMKNKVENKTDEDKEQGDDTDESDPEVSAAKFQLLEKGKYTELPDLWSILFFFQFWVFFKSDIRISQYTVERIEETVRIKHYFRSFRESKKWDIFFCSPDLTDLFYDKNSAIKSYNSAFYKTP